MASNTLNIESMAIESMAGNRDSAVVRALASHQCGPGSIPGPGDICRLSLCWFSTLLRGFFSGHSGFPPSAKNRYAAYSSWLLAVLQGHAWSVQSLPAAPIYAFGPTLSSCVLAVLARAISETVTPPDGMLVRMGLVGR